MSQDYQLPPLTDGTTTGRTKHNNSLEALRSSFSGAAAPPTPVDGQPWYDTTNKIWNIRINGAWVAIAADGAPPMLLHSDFVFAAAPAAYNPARTFPIAVAPVPMLISAATLATSKASAGSTGGNNWEATIANMTTSVLLASTPWNSNGDEIVVGTAKDLAVDQFLTVAAGDVLGLRILSTGGPTSMATEVWATSLSWGPA